MACEYRVLQLCLFGLIAAVAASMRTPIRPNISETFSGWFESTSLYLDGVSMSYEASSAYVSVVANRKSLINSTFRGEIDSILDLYDEGMAYYITGDPIDGSFCENVSVTVEDYFPMWSFQSDLEYVGRHETLNADVWNAGYSDGNITLAVSTTNPNTPLLYFLTDFYSATITKIGIIGFSNMPNDSDFNVPSSCYADYNDKRFHSKPRHSKSSGIRSILKHGYKKNQAQQQRRHNENRKRMLNAFNKFKLF